jgi:transcriptional regulator with XRE-family HTH domain
MSVAKAEVTSFYKSGFKKEPLRGKHNLIINERLKQARNRSGLSALGVVKKLAKQGVIIGHSTLQGYEADESTATHRYPSLPNLLQLAEFYGCSVDYLVGNSDRFKPNTGTRDQDVKDLLESRHAVTYNGITLNKKQREFLVAHLDSVVAEVF